MKAMCCMVEWATLTLLWKEVVLTSGSALFTQQLALSCLVVRTNLKLKTNYHNCLIRWSHYTYSYEIWADISAYMLDPEGSCSCWCSCSLASIKTKIYIQVLLIWPLWTPYIPFQILLLLQKEWIIHIAYWSRKTRATDDLAAVVLQELTHVEKISEGRSDTRLKYP